MIRSSTYFYHTDFQRCDIHPSKMLRLLVKAAAEVNRVARAQQDKACKHG